MQSVFTSLPHLEERLGRGGPESVAFWRCSLPRVTLRFVSAEADTLGGSHELAYSTARRHVDACATMAGMRTEPLNAGVAHHHNATLRAATTATRNALMNSAVSEVTP